MESFFTLKAKTLKGKSFDFSQLNGKKVMIVNVASECGFTKQYTQLQELYEYAKTQGLEILAFPCNDFGKQEPASEDVIQSFCTKNYGVTFPIMEKVQITDASHRHPVFKWLMDAGLNSVADYSVEWNFTKFLVVNGQLVCKLEPAILPIDPAVLSTLELSL